MFLKSLIIYLLIILTSLFSNPREEKIQKEKQIQTLLQNFQYEELISQLENYLEKYPYEKKYQLYLARAYLLQPIGNIARKEDPFQKEEKKSKIYAHYKKAQSIYSKVVLEWENIFPNEPSLGYWYFEWALLEHILGNKEKAISLYKKSSTFHEFPKEAFYNSGILLLELGLEKEAWKKFKKYYSYENFETP